MNPVQCQTAEGILFTNTYQLPLTYPLFPVGSKENHVALSFFLGKTQISANKTLYLPQNTNHNAVREHRKQRQN